MTKQLSITLIDFTAAAFATLDGYAGLTKLMHHHDFYSAILHSPAIARYATLLSLAIPVAEIIISVLLIIPKTRLTGLTSATILMAILTTYVAMILASSGSLPCTCGGIISRMGWKAHLMLNSAFLVAGLWAIIISIRYKNLYSYKQE